MLVLPRRNPEIARHVTVVPNRKIQIPLALLGTLLLTSFLVIHIVKDLSTPVNAWYFHSTLVWVIVMGVATLIYLREIRNLRRRGVDIKALFSKLPPE